MEHVLQFDYNLFIKCYYKEKKIKLLYVTH